MKRKDLLLVIILSVYLSIGFLMGATIHHDPKPKVITKVITKIITLNNDTPTPEVIAAWYKVAWCETHTNWKHQGNIYEGGLGILAYNWKHYGGTEYADHAWLATPIEQIKVAVKIQNGLPIPDQNGTCSAW